MKRWTCVINFHQFPPFRPIWGIIMLTYDFFIFYYYYFLLYLIAPHQPVCTSIPHLLMMPFICRSLSSCCRLNLSSDSSSRAWYSSNIFCACSSCPLNRASYSSSLCTDIRSRSCSILISAWYCKRQHLHFRFSPHFNQKSAFIKIHKNEFMKCICGLTYGMLIDTIDNYW